MCDFVIVVAISWDSKSNKFLLFSLIDGTVFKLSMTEISAVMADDTVLSLPWNDIQVQFYGCFSLFFFFSCIGCALPIETEAGSCQYIYGWVYISIAHHLPHTAKMFQLYLLWGSDSYQKSDNFPGGTCERGYITCLHQTG